jgi:hypothetical protein
MPLIIIASGLGKPMQDIGQGNRISDLGEEVCKEIVAPASSFDFAPV